MRPIPSLSRPLYALLLALVLAQWTVVTHGYQHATPSGGESSCEFCLLAPGLGDALPQAMPAALPPTVVQEAPCAALRVSSAAVLVTAHPIRGPPVFFA